MTTEPPLLSRCESVPELTAGLYAELRRLAAQFLRREANHSLQPTALVHEAYIRLASWKDFRFQSRAEFFGAASFVMRRVLAEAGRRRSTLKRGASTTLLVSLDDAEMQTCGALVDVLAIDQALRRLEEIHPKASRVVEIRIFGGLTIPETAAYLNVSPATVKRHWITARAWLTRELTPR